MTDSYLERELKFDVDPAFVVPAVEPFLPADGQVAATTVELRSDYFDTEDHALLRAGITLRKRSGDADTGWQLKVPAGAFREEISVADPEADDVPAELSVLIAGVVHGQSVGPVATVLTTRALTRLLDPNGQLLAEIADDAVRASAGGDAATLSNWRELEVELGNDDLDLLTALSKCLRRAGARKSSSSSKLSRALGGDIRPAPPKRAKHAGEVIGAYVAEQRSQILIGDLTLRRGDESVVHKTRVATRRLRSTVRIFDGLFTKTRSVALDEELRWFAGLLGAVRDQQVLQARLRAMIADVEPTLRLGPVQTRMNREIRRDWLRSSKSLQAALVSDRYYALIAEIDDWVQAPPLTARASRQPSTLRKPVRRAERKVAKRLRAADRAGDVTLLHRARKSAKRARYANEAATAVIGSKAAEHAVKSYQRLQDVLGEHQDSLLSAELLRRTGAKAGTLADENGFTFGILHERETNNALRAEAEAHRTLRHYL